MAQGGTASHAEGGKVEAKHYLGGRGTIGPRRGEQKRSPTKGKIGLFVEAVKNRIFTTLFVALGVIHAATAAIKVTGDAIEPIYREFTFRETPTFNRQSKFELVEWNVPSLWEGLGIQVFQPWVVNTDSRWPRNPVIYSEGRILPFVRTVGGGLLSGVVVGNTLFYSYGYGSGIHVSAIGRLWVQNGMPLKLESVALSIVDLLVEAAGNRVRVTLRSFPGQMTIEPIGWIDLKERNQLTVVDASGKEVSLSALGDDLQKRRGAR